MKNSTSLLLVGFAFLVSTLAWCDEGILVSDYQSRGKVFRVYSDGKVESVFPPASELIFQNRKGITQVDISPTQQFIAYVFQGDIWLYNVTKKATSRVTHVGKPYTKQFASVNAWIKRWSTDGNNILYSISAGETEDPEGYEPDRKERQAEYGVFTFNLQTGRNAQVPFPDRSGDAPAWLANGDFIFIEKGRFARYDPTTKKTKVLSPTFSGLNGWQVDVSCDETQMVFTVDSSGRMKNSALVRLDIASGKSTALTQDGGWTEFQFPKFSPSGKRISYLHRIGTSATRFPLMELVVDGKAINSFEGNWRYDWLDESTLVLKTARSGEFEVAILNADAGVVIVKKKWE